MDAACWLSNKETGGFDTEKPSGLALVSPRDSFRVVHEASRAAVGPNHINHLYIASK